MFFFATEKCLFVSKSHLPITQCSFVLGGGSNNRCENIGSYISLRIVFILGNRYSMKIQDLYHDVQKTINTDIHYQICFQEFFINISHSCSVARVSGPIPYQKMDSLLYE